MSTHNTWKVLLAKYIAHVSAAEGSGFALSENIAPCHMLNLEFTEENKLMLAEVFGAVDKWQKHLSPTQKEPLCIDKLFNKILPCPFCDAKAIFDYDDNDEGMGSVQCTNWQCSARIFDDRDSAIESWNKRTK